MPMWLARRTDDGGDVQAGGVGAGQAAQGELPDARVAAVQLRLQQRRRQRLAGQHVHGLGTWPGRSTGSGGGLP